MNTNSKYTLFIADTHLSTKQTTVVANLLAFLASEPLKNAEALYILGDFFMLWSGDDDPSDLSKTIKMALRAQTQNGKKIFLLPGNRDFLLGEDFANECGITMLADPTVIDLYGRATLLTHGDILCGKDAVHRRFRTLSQNPTTKKIFFKLPFWLRQALAYTFHYYSEARTKKPIAIMDQMAQESSPQIMLKYNVTQVIHGHLHQQKVVNFESNNVPLRRINLGNWQNNEKSILMYHQNGEIEFVN